MQSDPAEQLGIPNDAAVLVEFDGIYLDTDGRWYPSLEAVHATGRDAVVVEPLRYALWNESQHPRDHGRFAPKGTGTLGSKAMPVLKKLLMNLIARRQGLKGGSQPKPQSPKTQTPKPPQPKTPKPEKAKPEKAKPEPKPSPQRGFENLREETGDEERTPVVPPKKPFGSDLFEPKTKIPKNLRDDIAALVGPDPKDHEAFFEHLQGVHKSMTDDLAEYNRQYDNFLNEVIRDTGGAKKVTGWKETTDETGRTIVKPKMENLDSIEKRNYVASLKKAWERGEDLSEFRGIEDALAVHDNADYFGEAIRTDLFPMLFAGDEDPAYALAMNIIKGKKDVPSLDSPEVWQEATKGIQPFVEAEEREREPGEEGDPDEEPEAWTDEPDDSIPFAKTQYRKWCTAKLSRYNRLREGRARRQEQARKQGRRACLCGLDSSDNPFFDGRAEFWQEGYETARAFSIEPETAKRLQFTTRGQVEN